VSTTPSARPGRPASALRERVVRAAVELTAEVGWSRVTMAVLADHVGVSRQTVYNEMGTKAGLAEAMILHELERFLAVVDAAFDATPTTWSRRSRRPRWTC
jgi:AcrR family transcriptional regulator